MRTAAGAVTPTLEEEGDRVRRRQTLSVDSLIAMMTAGRVEDVWGEVGEIGAGAGSVVYHRSR